MAKSKLAKLVVGRSKEEVTAEYAEHCKLLGDFVIKTLLFNAEVQKLMNSCNLLNEEMEALVTKEKK